MTDFLIDPNTNDWKVENNRISIVPDTITLTRQRIKQRLHTFQDTLFTDLDYGMSFDLIASATSKEDIDQHIKGLVLQVVGVVSLQSFTSNVNEDGEYSAHFEVIGAENEVIPVEYSTVNYNNPLQQEGIWFDGGFNAFGVFDNEEILGSN